VGTYTGTFGQSWTGWADPAGNQVVSFTLTVTSESTASIDWLYDTSVDEITVETWTHARPAGGTEAWVNDRPELVTFAHSAVPGGALSFAAEEAPSMVTRARNLVDYGSAYGVYTGACAANRLDQSTGGWSSTELAKIPAEYLRSVVADVSKSIRIFEPSFNVRVRLNDTYRSDVRITFNQLDTGCAGTVHERRTGLGGRVPIGQGAMPYGTYEICAYIPDATRRACKTAKNDLYDGRPVEFSFDDDDDEDGD